MQARHPSARAARPTAHTHTRARNTKNHTLCGNTRELARRPFVCLMADRSDYLPAARLQELAQTIDPKLELEPLATQVGILPRIPRRRVPSLPRSMCIDARDRRLTARRSCRISQMTLWRTWRRLRASWRATAAARRSRRAMCSWRSVSPCLSPGMWAIKSLALLFAHPLPFCCPPVRPSE